MKHTRQKMYAIGMASVITFVGIFGINTAKVPRVSADTSVVTAHIQVTHGQTICRDMLNQINAFRQGEDAWAWDANNQKETYTDLEGLNYDYALEEIAMRRAIEIAVSYSHTRPDGQSCFTAFTDSFANGYKGENIAAGYSSADAVFQGWLETDEDYAGQGHRRNMLNRNFKSIGIAHVKYNGIDYWVQNFSSQSSGASQTVVNDSTAVEEVNILSSNITGIQTDGTSYQLAKGDTVSLSQWKLRASITGYWSYSSATCPLEDICEATVADDQIVSVQDGMLVAKAAGTTTVTLTAFGLETQIQVTVTDTGSGTDATKAPDATAPPESTNVPGATNTPETTNVPGATKAPETTNVPGTTESPKNSSTPDTTKSPDTSGTTDGAGNPVVKPAPTGTPAAVVKTNSIKSQKVTGVKVKQKKKTAKATVKFRKIKGATGYQVVYAWNKKFTKKQKIKTTRKTSVVLSGLKHKKTYYIKVRAYTLDAYGQKQYSKYSKIIKRKIK